MAVSVSLRLRASQVGLTSLENRSYPNHPRHRIIMASFSLPDAIMHISGKDTSFSSKLIVS